MSSSKYYKTGKRQSQSNTSAKLPGLPGGWLSCPIGLVFFAGLFHWVGVWFLGCFSDSNFFVRI